jgi:hypothetical protein
MYIFYSCNLHDKFLIIKHLVYDCNNSLSKTMDC